jgi:GNAT superfamily N-acetyltransferase
VGSDVAGAHARPADGEGVIRVAPLDAQLFAAWSALFDAASSPCFCRFWHFEGTKNDWLARCAFEPHTSRAEQEEALACGDDATSGLVALEGDRALGWMKLAPRASLPKLRKQSVYRAHDLGSDDGVFSVGCFLVDPAHRHRGVARALLEAAPAFVRARGGRAIEAYPRRTREPMHDEEAWMGPEPLYIACGFVPAFGEEPYPVLRLVLT